MAKYDGLVGVIPGDGFAFTVTHIGYALTVPGTYFTRVFLRAGRVSDELYVVFSGTSEKYMSSTVDGVDIFTVHQGRKVFPSVHGKHSQGVGSAATNQ